MKGIGSGGQAAALDRSRRSIEIELGGRTVLRLGSARAVDCALLKAHDDVSFPSMSEAAERAEGEDGGGVRSPLFEELYRRHWTDLCRYVLRNFGSGPPDPEDVAQQAFVRLSGVSAAVDNVGSFLRKTARNLVIDHYRASVRSSNFLSSISILEEDSADFSPEDVLSSKEELKELNSVIATLPPKERIALLMHRVDGAAFTDIAAHLGVSHSGARLLVSRAFERCAAAMEGRP